MIPVLEQPNKSSETVGFQSPTTTVACVQSSATSPPCTSESVIQNAMGESQGNCPIYNYRYAANASPSYYSCTNFTSGCPSKMYFSKDVYKYKECLEINVTKRCYVAEICSPKSDNEDKRTTEYVTITTSSSRPNDHECETKNTCTSICATVATILCIISIPTTSLITVYVKNWQERKREGEEESEENVQLVTGVEIGKRGGGICMELPGLSALKKSAEFFPFNRFKGELCTLINKDDKLQDLKTLALGVEVTQTESINSAEDLLKLLVSSHSLHKNLIYLQVLFFRVNAINLMTLCMEFGENHRLLYLELRQTSKGDEYIIHLSEVYEDSDLDSLRNTVHTMLEIDKERIRIQSE